MIRSKQRVFKRGGGLICFLAPFITFFVILGSGFVMWDDDRAIVNNPVTGGLSLERLPVIFGDLQSTSHFTPVTGLFRSLIYEMFVTPEGIDAFGYHLGSLLLHATSTVLLYLICYEWIDILRKQRGQKANPSWRRRQVVISILGALLWSLHPLRVEPVAWASSGSYCLATTFAFLSVWFYLQHVQSKQRLLRDPLLWYAVAAYFLSLLSHPIVLGFFLVLLVIDIFPLRRLGTPLQWWRSPEDRGVLLEKVPFVLAGMLVGLVTVALQMFYPNYSDPPSPPWELFGLLARTMQGLYVWVYFVWRVWVPFNLSPTYTALVHIQLHPLRMIFLLSAASFFGISLLVFWLRKRSPALLAAWSCHLIMVFPILGVTQGNHVTNDRYSLTVSIIWSLLFVGLMTRSYRKEIYRIGIGLSLLVVIGLAIASYRQAKVWHDTESLFTHVLHVMGDDPGREDIYLRLARHYLMSGDSDRTEEAVLKSLAIRPSNAESRMLYATVLLQTGRYEKCLAQIQRLLDEGAFEHDALCLRGMVYMNQKQWDAAEQAFQQVLNEDPDFILAKQQMNVVAKLRDREPVP